MGRRARGLLILLAAVLPLAFLLHRLPGTIPHQTAPERRPPLPGRAARTLPLAPPGCLPTLPPRQASVALERPDPGTWYPVSPGLGPNGLEDRCGTVWFGGSSGLDGFLRGDPTRRVRLPAGGEALAQLDPHTAEAALLTERGDLWLLTWRRSTLRLRAGAWEVFHTDPPEVLPLEGLAEHRGLVYLGAGRLLVWNEARSAWEPAPQGIGGRTLHSAPWGTLYVGDDGGLYTIDDPVHPDGFRLWDSRDERTRPRVVASDGQARILVGTGDGLYVLGRDGTELEHALPGVAVSGVVARPGGALWVSSTDHGLWYGEGGRWYPWAYAQGLGTDGFRGLYLDRNGRLWATGGSPLVGDAHALESEIKTLRTPEPLPARVFPDACAAVEALAPAPTSGDLGWSGDGEECRVFFQGRQVCPDPGEGKADRPLVLRRGDGARLTSPFNGLRLSRDCRPAPCTGEAAERMRRDWTFTLQLGDRTLVVDPPQPLPGETPGRFFFDSRDRIWVGTRDGGLYLWEGRQWRRFGVDDQLGPGNPATDFAEDAAGAVWVGSSPRYDPQLRRYVGANLHQRSEGNWSHWSPDQGLPYWHTSAVAATSLGVAVGTNGGLALIGPEGVLALGHRQMDGGAFVSYLAADPQGGLWLATRSDPGGLLHFDGSRVLRLTTREGLFDNRIKRIAPDAEGRVWLQNADGGVAVYPRETLLGVRPAE